MSTSAFISYAHEDRAHAVWIAIELRAIGIDVYRDAEQLSGGDRLSVALEKAVTDADVFVLIATPSGLESEWTRRECEWALRANRRICPIYSATNNPKTV